MLTQTWIGVKHWVLSKITVFYVLLRENKNFQFLSHNTVSKYREIAFVFIIQCNSMESRVTTEKIIPTAQRLLR